jgi:aminoglycoside phosphotransferase (APT) family kinase protein
METSDSHWLFLEYAGGVEWNRDIRAHRDLAARWLAEMHGSSAHLEPLSQLPGRGPDYYLSQLTTARQRILENVSNPALDAEGRRILDEFIACSGLLETRWKEIEAFCESVPETLVHNDFLSKNAHVHDTNAGPALLVFDWEMSGRGIPATDLFWMFQQVPDATITRYWEHLRQFNSHITLQEIEYLAILGAIFRITDAVEWVSQYLLTEYPDRKMHHTRLHTERLKLAFQALGWS